MMGVKFRVEVHYSDDYERLTKIVQNVRELQELIPDWSHFEAEKLTDEILELAKDSINTKRK